MTRKRRTEATRRLVRAATAEVAVLDSVRDAFEGLMRKQALTKTAMARHLGVPESHVHRMVTERNFTLRSLARTVAKFDHRVVVKFEPLAKKGGRM